MVSSRPSKQRQMLREAPKHLRHKMLTAKLAEDLAKQYGIKRLSIRKGDTVKVLRGEHLGYEGKVADVNTKTGRIAIEGLTRKKADGTPVFVWVHASKVIITKLDTSDKERVSSIDRKRKAREDYFKKKEEKKEGS
ncbi:50S ribosomal protein L24 [Stygiolobus caldivivus]|uniref:Large ribosomal subunit protein uL24 n=1 Tax=Stygiolobus caldivivus TaxID=2824673 RepID=A0A8D5ZG41_9CREN|nr:50S ribosomal protein L24 [Stygiolobus caldivivus]BCU70648.1 50S ribosomal protein L24 [Stygiolobus caldivivus]